MLPKSIAATPGMLRASWRKVIPFIFLFSLFFFCILLQSATAQAPLVSLQNGQLVYNKYANAHQTNVVNQIPDFSNCGYRGGGVKLPDVPVVKTIQAMQGNCRALIQNAIDSVSAL